MRADLHTHSTVSDGTQSPRELVASAKAAGIDVLGLTDHDSTAGWAEAEASAADLGVSLLRGIEISCQAGGISVHLLAYLLDPAAPGLVAELVRSRESRHTRARRIVERLAADLPISFEEVLATAAPGATLGRPHIADALVAKRIVASRDEAFATYLHAGSPYFTSHYAPDVVRAVRLVREAGGVPVMAHPFAGRRGYVVGDDVVERMAGAGLAGLEVHHPDHDPKGVEHGLALARRLELFVTGSSDYHGTGKANRLGQHLTQERVLRVIEEQAQGIDVLRA